MSTPTSTDKTTTPRNPLPVYPFPILPQFDPSTTTTTSFIADVIQTTTTTSTSASTTTRTTSTTPDYPAIGVAIPGLEGVAVPGSVEALEFYLVTLSERIRYQKLLFHYNFNFIFSDVFGVFLPESNDEQSSQDAAQNFAAVSTVIGNDGGLIRI